MERLSLDLNPILTFYAKAKADVRLLPTHQSLYLALFFLWRQSGCADLFTVSRRELMPLARLQSIATYHKCIRELKAFGYIEYHPTYNYYEAVKSGCWQARKGVQMITSHLHSYEYSYITAPKVQTCPADRQQAMFRYTETACRISTHGCLPESAALRLAERGG